MAVSYSDMDALRQDAAFKARVRAAIVKGCVTIGIEDPRTVADHRERTSFTTQVINNPDSFLQSLVDAIVTDSVVINAATSNGTIAITGANAAARGAVVTDANIDTSLNTVFNAFFRRPA